MKKTKEITILGGAFNLVNLFSLFVFGTTCFLLYVLLIPYLSFKLKQTFSFAIILFGTLSYEIVIGILIVHYLIKGKVHYEKHKSKYFWLMVLILMLTYSFADAFTGVQFSISVLIRDIALSIITVILGPIISNKLLNRE